MNVSEAKLSVTPENTSSPDKSQNQSPHIVDPQAIDKMDDDGVALGRKLTVVLRMCSALQTKNCPAISKFFVCRALF